MSLVCVVFHRSCTLALSGLDLPNEATELLQQLVFDMRSHCMTRLLEQAISGQCRTQPHGQG